MAFKQKQTSGKKEYDNTNRGVLFVNDKGDNDKRPDKRGFLTIKAEDFAPGDDGLVRIDLSAWVNQNETHGEIISIKASPPRE